MVSCSRAQEIGGAALARYERSGPILERLMDRWRLRHPRPMVGATCSLLYEVETEGVSAALKYPLDPDEATHGLACLEAMSEHGGIKVLRVDPESGTVLMERAIPGIPLHEAVPDDEEATLIMARTIQRLREMPDGDGNPLEVWYRELYEAQEQKPNPRYAEAIRVYEWLRATSPAPRLQHGDLHHFNLLQHGNEWVAIDPKGVSLDPSYEVCAFLRNPYPEISEDPRLVEKTRERIRIFSEVLGDDPRRIWGWGFAQITLDSTYEDGFSQACTKVSKALWQIGVRDSYLP